MNEPEINHDLQNYDDSKSYISKNRKKITVNVDDSKIDCDKVLVAVGVKANSSNLGLKINTRKDHWYLETGSGMGPDAVGYVLGITKAYTTRVGSGPFPTEQENEIGQFLGERGHEFGTTTGRKRRCGWFDAALVRQTIKLGGIHGIALTKLDVLDGLDEIKICVGYELNGERIDYLPAAQAAQADLKPIYETMPGWKETTYGARTWGELPAAAVKYVKHVEELIGAPVTLLSTSPERDDTILMQDPFEG